MKVILGLGLLFFAGTVTGAELTVTQKNKTFMPSDLQIKVGDVVSFLNEDDTAHHIFSTSPSAKFNHKQPKGGDAIKQKFEKEGEVHIRCAIHPKMKLKVVVSK